MSADPHNMWYHASAQKVAQVKSTFKDVMMMPYFFNLKYVNRALVGEIFLQGLEKSRRG